MVLPRSGRVIAVSENNAAIGKFSAPCRRQAVALLRAVRVIIDMSFHVISQSATRDAF